MGFTCSLLGHARGDPETERDREERGDEVVVVTREVRECRRCGDRAVVSENTEVRHAPEEADPEPDGEAASGPDPDTAEDSSVAEGPSVAEDSSAAEDDGVILDSGDPGDSERAPGEWPSAGDTRVEQPPDRDAPGGETVAEAADTGDDPGTETEPAPAGSVADVTDREWPDEGPAEESTPATGIAATDSAEAADGEDTVFVCPSCEFRESSSGSSHRSGDICPECRRGYLAERTRN